MTETTSPSSRVDGGLTGQPRLAVVTGGGGFIGRHLVAELQRAGHTIRVLDPALAEDADLGPQTTVIQGSILDEAVLAQALDGADWCFHLAAIAHLWQRDPSRYDEVNRVGTERVLAAARSAGVGRTIVTASEAIYASAERTAASPAIAETTPIPAQHLLPGPYTRSKAAAAEAACQARAGGQDVVLAIPTAPIGPGDHNQTPPTRMLADLLAGKLPAYLACELDVIDVREVALGHLRIAELPQADERYLLAGVGLPLDDILRMAAAAADVRAPQRRVPAWLARFAAVVQESWAAVSGRPPAASREGVRLALCHLRFDATLSRSALGLPQADPQAALADAVAWLRSYGS